MAIGRFLATKGLSTFRWYRSRVAMKLYIQIYYHPSGLPLMANRSSENQRSVCFQRENRPDEEASSHNSGDQAPRSTLDVRWDCGLFLWSEPEFAAGQASVGNDISPGVMMTLI